MSVELASAYVSLIPSLKGAAATITAQLGGVDVSASGRKIGESLSAGMSAGVSTAAITQLENAVSAASSRYKQAVNSQKDATAQLAIAEQKLVEARSRHAAGSSQVMAAELRVEQANRKVGEAALKAKSAETEMKNAEDRLAAAHEKTANSGSKLKGSLDGIGNAAKGGIGKIAGAASAIGAVAAVGSAIGSIVPEAAAAADATTKFQSTLTFAGLDSGQIEALTKSTREYANSTVFDMQDIQGATAALAANGVPNYDRLAEAAGNLTAVNGGGAEAYKSVTMAMTQTAGAGKLMAENWNQLTDAIPGASGRLQDAMREAGAYTGDFRLAMERGEITAEEFNAAIMELGFEKASIDAAKSTETFEGAMGNFKSTVVTGMGDVFTEIRPLVTGALNAATPVVEGLFSRMADAAGKAMDFIAAAAPHVQAAFDTVGNALGPVVSAISGAMFTIKSALGRAFETLAPVVESLFASLSPLLAGLATAIAPVIGVIASAIGTIIDIAAQVGAVLAPIIEQVVTFVTGTILPIVMPAIQAITSAVTSAMPLIEMVITGALNVIQAVWNAVWPVLQAVVEPIITGISTFIQGAMGAIQAVISIVMAAINGNWSGVWAGIGAFVDSIWAAITGLIGGAIDAVKGFIQTGMDTIKGIWDSAWGSVSSFVSSTWESVKTAVSDGIEGMMGFISGLPDRIMGFFSDAGSWLVNSGRSIIDGLVDGIRGAIDGAINAVSGAVQSIRDLFPFSPAKKGPFSGHGWVLYSGMSIADAMADGFTRRVPSMVSAYESGMNSLSAASGPTVSARALPASSTDPAARSGINGDGAGDTLRRIERVLCDIYGIIPPGMTEREFGRKVRRAVAYA